MCSSTVDFSATGSFERSNACTAEAARPASQAAGLAAPAIPLRRPASAGPASPPWWPPAQPRLLLLPPRTAQAEAPAALIAPEPVAATKPKPTVSALATWRLKRAVAHMEANLNGPITLADLAGAAGLTRMHFAAQFRVATGFKPSEYLRRRRIARAQQLLAGSTLRLVEVALEVGFQTQAHFTTVFKQFTGETPAKWRDQHYDGAEPLTSSGSHRVYRQPAAAFPAQRQPPGWRPSERDRRRVVPRNP